MRQWSIFISICILLVKILTHILNESGGEMTCIISCHNVFQQVAVLVEIDMRHEIIWISLGVEIPVDLFKIHIVCNFGKEAELQSTTSEFSYNAIIIVANDTIIAFHPDSCHVKVDDHIGSGLKGEPVFIKTNVLHSCFLVIWMQRYNFVFILNFALFCLNTAGLPPRWAAFCQRGIPWNLQECMSWECRLSDRTIYPDHPLLP